ncbi:hypothetical protein GGR58DRAFT_379474 [Xylaria digitata]|nr:hypothetical protein GGR58DRAFT_379474 [Xylaria digitata]
MSLVVEAKEVGRSTAQRNLCDTGLQLFQKAARYSLRHPTIRDFRLIDHLDGVLTYCSGQDHWLKLHLWKEDVSTYSAQWAAKITHLEWYLYYKLSTVMCQGMCNGPQVGPICHLSVPTLVYAMGFDNWSQYNITRGHTLDLVQIAYQLDRGGNPNESYCGNTIWQCTLHMAHHHHESRGDWADRHTWLKLFILMLEHGASKRAMCSTVRPPLVHPEVSSTRDHNVDPGGHIGESSWCHAVVALSERLFGQTDSQEYRHLRILLGREMERGRECIAPQTRPRGRRHRGYFSRQRNRRGRPRQR